jgi:hypothetical protein
MSYAEQRDVERRRWILLAPLMIAGNVFLLLCMVGLCIVAIGGVGSFGILPLGGDANQQIVKAYLAENLPSYRYRIREFFPAAPLEGKVAQRVKLVFYGPNGARQLDTTYWIQDGKVTRRMESDLPPTVLRPTTGKMVPAIRPASTINASQGA